MSESQPGLESSHRLRKIQSKGNKLMPWVQVRRWFIWFDWIPVVNEYRKAQARIIANVEAIQEDLLLVEHHKNDVQQAFEDIENQVDKRRRLLRIRDNITSDNWRMKRKPREDELPDVQKEYDKLVKRYNLDSWKSGDPRAPRRGTGKSSTDFYDKSNPPPDRHWQSESASEKLHAWDMQRKQNPQQQRKKGQQNQNQ